MKILPPAAPIPQGLTGAHLEACPLCGGTDLNYLFGGSAHPLVACQDCTLVMRNPQPTAGELQQQRVRAEHSPESGQAPSGEEAARLRRVAGRRLDQVERYAAAGAPLQGRTLLEIGCGTGDLLVAAQARGYRVLGVEASARAAAAVNQRLGGACVHADLGWALAPPGERVAICVIREGLARSPDPVALLNRVYDLMEPGGVLLVSFPSGNRGLARGAVAATEPLGPETLFYFNADSAQSLLFRCGFCQVSRLPASVGGRGGWGSRLAGLLRGIAAPLVRGLASSSSAGLALPGEGMTFLARRSAAPAPSRRRQKLSVIMPVFNERSTFRLVLDELLAKPFDDLDLELIIVESNSTDGTREEVLSYQSTSRVRVVLEERPQGKGHAVRAGLKEAQGDFVLIQDADLEYDLNDYEVLLKPLRHYRRAFVLGSRHSESGWKIRHFEDQILASGVLNLGHLFFTALFNVLYGERLKDPFTMYKVFRRECLYGLEFECNRFDFDFELVAKLVRRGFHPLEIPINYRSRSFHEGKKVSMFRDPPTWIRAAIKYRFVRLTP